MRALILLPTYEEAGSIRVVLEKLREHAPLADVLVIDDNSCDGTADIARAVAQELGRIQVLCRERKEGLGPAYRAGFEKGIKDGYDVLVQMDSDLSHDPTVVPLLLAAVEDGADLVIGSRYVPGGSIPVWPPHRRALSRYGNEYAAAVLGLSIADLTSGFRALRTTTAVRIGATETTTKGYGLMIELAYRSVKTGSTVIEVPITFIDRTHGKSKLSLAVALEELAIVTLWGVRDRVTNLLKWLLRH